MMLLADAQPVTWEFVTLVVGTTWAISVPITGWVMHSIIRMFSDAKQESNLLRFQSLEEGQNHIRSEMHEDFGHIRANMEKLWGKLDELNRSVRQHN